MTAEVPAAPREQDLTRNQALVWGALSDSPEPLSAYTILDQLRGEGFRAPLQVYRALEKLVEFRMVHRLESLNAFIACRHSGCSDHATIAFAICDECGKVSEITDDVLENQLMALADRAGFAPNRSIIEIRGLCRDCRSV